MIGGTYLYAARILVEALTNISTRSKCIFLIENLENRTVHLRLTVV